MNFPSQVQIKKLAAQHPDYQKNAQLWERIRLLYEGGEDFKKRLIEFLHRRPSEMLDVYNSRLTEARDGYTNILQAIIGWYLSAEFKEIPAIIARREDWRDQKEGGGDPLSSLDLELSDQEFIDNFLENCDGAGNDFVKWWRERVEPGILLYQKMYIHIDLPDKGQKLYNSLGQQIADGALSPILSVFHPQDVINWGVDKQGNLEWLVIQSTVSEQDGPLDDMEVYDRWWIFDREQVAFYQYQRRKGERESKKPIETANATLQDVKSHALSDKGICPFFVHQVTDDKWLGNRLVGPIVKYFNLSNCYDWCLEEVNVPTLCIYSDDDVDLVKRSETSFIKFNQGDKAAYLEPSGHGFSVTANRVNDYREDIYRNAYLIDQGRSSTANAAMQSGISKEQDKMPARDVLSSLGDNARFAMQWVLQCVCNVGNAKIDMDIQGLDFKDRYDATELDFLIKAEFLDVNSPTYKREKAKKLVRLVLPDCNRAVHQQFDSEIEDNLLPEQLLVSESDNIPDPSGSGTVGMTGQPTPTRGQKAAATVSQAAKQTLNNMAAKATIRRIGAIKSLETNRMLAGVNSLSE